MLIFFLAALDSEEDRRKFTAIYEQYHTRLENTAICILKNQNDAEDAVQNAFVQIIRHFEKISEISCEELPFWLISIVKNESLMILRKRSRRVSLTDLESFADTAKTVTEYSKLVELFRQLPATYRTVLEMKILFGYSDRDISRHLGISETAVSTRANRGRALLREIAEREGFHPFMSICSKVLPTIL